MAETATEKVIRLQKLAAEIAAAITADVEVAVGGEGLGLAAAAKKCTSGFFCGKYNCEPPFSCSEFDCNSTFTFGPELISPADTVQQ